MFSQILKIPYVSLEFSAFLNINFTVSLSPAGLAAAMEHAKL